MDKLNKTEDYHEDFGYVLFLHFPLDNDGYMLGEPPESEISHGYIEYGFDTEKWTHFVQLDFNSLMEQAGEINAKVKS